MSRDTIARIWREYGVQPWRAETFKFSTDPQLVAKVHDVVGLYLHPPERAVVLCVDEKSQIPSLGTHPARAPRLARAARAAQPRLCATWHHDLVRRAGGATGRITNQCVPRHRHPEFLAFLKQVGAYPRRRLHVICDNYATHKHPVVRGWLARHLVSSCTSRRPRRPG